MYWLDVICLLPHEVVVYDIKIFATSYFFNTRYKIQDTRFFISGKLPIVHDYIQCLIKC